MAGVTPGKKSTQSDPGKKPYQPAIGVDFGAVAEVEAKPAAFSPGSSR
jgi:hypothetical protein